MSRKPQKYRLFAQRLPEKAAENSQKNSHSEKAGFRVVAPQTVFKPINSLRIKKHAVDR